MNVIATKIPGAFVLEMEPRRDERGFFARAWCARELAERGLSSSIAQINTTWCARAGTIRGMHFQRAPAAEVKVVRCHRGAAYDVIVDLRPDSPTHRQWVGVELTAAGCSMVYAPEGCAHGYLSLRDDTEVSYTTSAFYAPGEAGGVRYDDPAFDIRWPMPVQIVSTQDASWPDYAT
ncbi:MAG: dTDP-4-dehydrorhamnose 3,5-epimerase family protein [Steroidobacteraceae bacterium]